MTRSRDRRGRPAVSKRVLFFRVLRLVRLFHDERFHAHEFLLKAIGKIVCPVFKKHDEAEGKKQKQGEPEQSAEQRHEEDGNLLKLFGQRLIIERQSWR